MMLATLPTKPKYSSASRPITRNLTPRQLDVLVAIRNHKHLNGYSPTLQELGDQLGITKIVILEHIQQLELKKYVTRLKGKARSLEIVGTDRMPDEDRPSLLPLLGTLEPGSPIQQGDMRESIDLEQLFGYRAGVYALRVKDDSFAAHNLARGDCIVLKKQEAARIGQTAVALDDCGRIIVGRVGRDDGNWKTAKIVGVVIGMVRGAA